MSECLGVRCDRCDARALIPESGSNIPDGWSLVSVVRSKPFLKGAKDLCPACTDKVFAALYEARPRLADPSK